MFYPKHPIKILLDSSESAIFVCYTVVNLDFDNIEEPYFTFSENFTGNARVLRGPEDESGRWSRRGIRFTQNY